MYFITFILFIGFSTTSDDFRGMGIFVGAKLVSRLLKVFCQEVPTYISRLKLPFTAAHFIFWTYSSC